MEFKDFVLSKELLRRIELRKEEIRFNARSYYYTNYSLRAFWSWDYEIANDWQINVLYSRLERVVTRTGDK